MELTTYEISIKYGISTSHLRRLLARKIINGRKAEITSKSVVWLVQEDSMKKYLRKERKPGPKAKN